MRNSIFYFIIGGVVAAALFGASSIVFKINGSKAISTQAVSSNRIQVTHTITFSPKEHKIDTVMMDAGSTALDLLKKTATVKTQGERENTFVTQIDGILADANKKEFWAFYVNDKQSDTGAGSYKLQKNDHIEWKREKFKEDFQIK